MMILTEKGHTVRGSTAGSASPQGQTRWDRFLYWSNRFFESDEFDTNERDYKLVVAERLLNAKRLFRENDPAWVDALGVAVTSKPNNLTNWRATQPFLAWCKTDPDQASLAMRFLWNADDPVHKRFDQFAQVVWASGQRIPIAETSFFHMAMDPCAFPMHRANAVERAMNLTGYPDPREAGIKTGEMGRRHEHFLRFLDIMMKRAGDAGIQFRDRLDAQGVSWTVTQWEPVKYWPEADRQAFLEYQGHAAMRKDSWHSL
ncbi:MAG: hypothetical protein WKF63_10545 [Thermomicrobiales bacterium]